MSMSKEKAAQRKQALEQRIAILRADQERVAGKLAQAQQELVEADQVLAG